MDENKNMEPLASEIYKDLKDSIAFKSKVIKWMAIIIALLVVALFATGIYHDYRWSQFDTFVVDGGDGGNANLVNGDNIGGINNGTNSSQSPQEVGLQGD